MNIRWFKRILFTLLASLPLSGCYDDLILNPDEIGEGMSRLSIAVDYEPDRAATLGSSRASGNAISDISELAVVIYKPDGVLYKIYNSVLPNTPTDEDRKLQLKFSQTKVKDNYPSDYGEGAEAAEDETARVTFKFPEAIPYGRYCMYVVANNGRITEEMAAEPETLKGQTVTWNFKDVSDNAEMFGFMTMAGEGNETSIGFEAPVITVNQPTVSLHSWVKRLASKVTIAYDGSGLNDNVWVYIHNVSLRQIPLSCKLGENNEPKNTTETGFVTSDDFGDAGKPATAFSSGQYFYYNTQGITPDNTDLFPNETQYANWMMLANGLPVKGSTHTQSDPALYFYENVQGDYSDLAEGPEKEKHNKQMKNPAGDDPDKAGENITPDMEGKDYKDREPYGTFIEVEAYYVAAPENDPAHKTEGPIKYRFMLGQDVKYNYEAFRNHHYKVTLGFKGWANQPDWHIEYYEEEPEIIVEEMYMPYLYNQKTELPLRFNGPVYRVELEIIENNWGPYLEGHIGTNGVTGTGALSAPNVPDMTVGEDNFANRTIQFRWNLPVYVNKNGLELPEPEANSSVESQPNNYLYGRHKTDYKYLPGDPKAGENYYVTPIWVGFLRLQQPQDLEDEGTPLPMTIFTQAGSDNDWRYEKTTPREGLKAYYFGDGGAGAWTNSTTDLHKRVFKKEDLIGNSEKGGLTHGNGRNSWTVQDIDVGGVKGKALTVKLWTQPKTMMYISGFSGNNPYEAYFRKAVIRVTAWFDDQKDPLVRDVPIIQARRLVNPKGVWRTSSNTNPFHFTLYDNQTAASTSFAPLVSHGSWSAKVITGSGITISPEGGSTTSPDGGVEGKTESNVNFLINFPGGQHFAIIEILYHGKSAVHYVICRQGYHTPIAIVDGCAEWSSYSLYKCDEFVNFGTSETDNRYIASTLTESPLALGSLFKKGNYNEGILISNLTQYGPRDPVNQGDFDLTNGSKKPWLDILGIARNKTTNDNNPPSSQTANQSPTTTLTFPTANGGTESQTFNSNTWKWAKFNATDKDGNTDHYRVPTRADFKDLLDYADLAVGVLYGDGATKPKDNTQEAYGFFDPSNSGLPTQADRGMRGVFVYNKVDARNIFFPIGTSGYARRTIQALPTNGWKNWAGVMRYSGVTDDLTGDQNSLRPIPYNMPNVPGAIYWIAQEVDNTFPGWEMNYFDLNFNPYDWAMSFGPYGDAVPIKLVKDGTGKP